MKHELPSRVGHIFLVRCDRFYNVILTHNHTHVDYKISQATADERQIHHLFVFFFLVWLRAKNDAIESKENGHNLFVDEFDFINFQNRKLGASEFLDSLSNKMTIFFTTKFLLDIKSYYFRTKKDLIK